MKAKNLQILKENGLNVPDFIIVNKEDPIDLSFSNASSFAVRSSYSLEDAENLSFAGQFKTILNVKRDDVAAAVDQVAKSYEQKLYQNIKNSNSDSPVIIQEMVIPDYAGVIFTANPLGILNEMVVTAGVGLGETIVTDQAETVTYYYNTDEAQFYQKEKSAFNLDHAALQELVGLAMKIKSIFQKEMDIEFAVRDNQIFILQARPITTLRMDNLLILDNSNIVESYPGVCLPITHDFVHQIYRDIFKSCILRVSKNKHLVQDMEDIFTHMVASYNGSIYYQITNWYEILRLLPFSNKLIAIWQEMLGVDNKWANDSSLHVSPLLKLKIVISFLYYLLATPKSMKKLGVYFDQIYPDYQEKIKNTDTVSDLLALFYEVEKSITSVWDITLINDMYTFLFTALSGGKKNEKIANISQMESMKPVLARNDLRKTAHENGVESPLYQAKEKEYIEAFGDRILGELKLETKTYRTNPELLREQILSTQSLDLKANVPKKSLNPFVNAAKCGIANREKSRLNRCRLFGLAREIILKIGAILAENHQLARKEDIFCLYFEEINPDTDYQTLIQQRKVQFQSYEASPHPKRIVFSNGILENPGIPCEDSYSGGASKQGCSHDIITLQGIPTSLGKVTGEAIVITDATLNLDVKDKIIVARSTDPGWVFLLENCSGIIAERGSLLSHTAIISRELGKPAIVNVKDATKIIKTGDLLELDANTGIIRVQKPLLHAFFRNSS